MLYNVGGASYVDPAGQVWLADLNQNNYPIFSPSDTPAEPRSPLAYPYNGPIGNTSNPQLYTTYRAFLTNSAQPRILTFNVPLNDGTYTVKLHMVDLYWTAAGQRVFNVSLEGVTPPNLVNEDIVAKVGPKNALVETVSGVQVTGGQLTITLNASVDYGALSGIEILR